MHKWRGRPGVSYYVIHGTGITCCHACIYSQLWRRPILHSVRSMKTREAPTALQTETGDLQTVAFQSDFELRYTFWSCNWFIGDAYLQYVVFTVFGLLVDYVTKHSSRSVLIFRKPNRRSTFIHCSYHCDSAYWHWEENVANESFSRLKRLTTTWAVIANYAPPLDDFWTNQLVIVGEAPHLPQTGYKACSYSLW